AQPEPTCSVATRLVGPVAGYWISDTDQFQMRLIASGCEVEAIYATSQGHERVAALARNKARNGLIELPLSVVPCAQLARQTPGNIDPVEGLFVTIPERPFCQLEAMLRYRTPLHKASIAHRSAL